MDENLQNIQAQEQPVETPTTPEPIVTTSLQAPPPRSRKKFFFIAFLVIAIIIGAYLLVRTRKAATNRVAEVATSTPTPTAAHYTGVDTATLVDVSGGDSSGSVTRTYTQDEDSHMVSAKLPDPQGFDIYQFWISRPGETIPIGTLTKGQGGTYSLSTTFKLEDPYMPFKFEDLYNEVYVSLETTSDTKMETVVLKGTFTH